MRLADYLPQVLVLVPTLVHARPVYLGCDDLNAAGWQVGSGSKVPTLAAHPGTDVAGALHFHRAQLQRLLTLPCHLFSFVPRSYGWELKNPERWK
jgi:hypothetical protein